MSKGYKLEFLISTMKRENDDFLQAMNISEDVIIINQTEVDETSKFKKDNQVITSVSSTERGISKSRNRAIKESSADICIICDDDLIYKADCQEKIKKAYELIPEADIIVFCFESKKYKKKYPKKIKKINYLSSMRIHSIQLTFKRESILENNLFFDEAFGTGSAVYQQGEENIFLFDCLKKGLNIYFVPQFIVSVDDEATSSWFKGYTEHYMRDKGAMFFRMAPKLYLLFILQFSIRKYKRYHSYLNFFQAIKWMLKGSEDYVERVKKQGS